MIFSSVQYLAFIVIVFLVYWQLPRKKQNLFLLLASYYFYACWDWRFLGLIVFSTILDFYTGPKIYNARSERDRKIWMGVSLAANLGVLAYFKYYNFFADSLVALFATFGGEVSQLTLDITLPVGISFYTFQTLSYSLDIYRRQLEPTDSFIDFAAFVALFPQLVAGPIVRAKEFLYQLSEERTFSGRDLEQGIIRFLQGYFKKTFIADNIGVMLADPVFAEPSTFTSATLWFAVIGYSIQIYADFSGYSSMAIGSARILGFTLPENFAFPYLATDFSDFWRRWHITMSRFFRDYVYIALGGNRGGHLKTVRNLAGTTLLSGLWHGAGWTFVAWGALHGLYIGIYQTWRRQLHFARRGRQLPKFATIFLAWLLTQSGVIFAWILFRSQDFATANQFLYGLFSSAGQDVIQPNWILGVAFATFIFDHIWGALIERDSEFENHLPRQLRALTYVAMIVLLFHTYSDQVNPFIYFDF